VIADDFERVQQIIESHVWGPNSLTRAAFERIKVVCDERLDAIARLSNLANRAWAGEELGMGRAAAREIRAALGPSYLGGPVPPAPDASVEL